MALPQRIQTKISSEAAGSISFTPVVRREMAAAELIECILKITGKDPGRVGEVLRGGTVVNGASRFRWEPIEAAAEEVAQALAQFPDPRPDLPFDAGRCVRARLTGGRAPIDLGRQAASVKRLLARQSFWDVLMAAAAGLPLTYQQYSYADRADLYHAELSAEAAGTLREKARLLRYSALESAVQEYAYHRLELWVERQLV